MVGPESEIDRPHLFEAAQQQARRRQQHQRNRNLSHHQRGPQPSVTSALRAAPPAFFEVRVHIGSQRRKRGSQPAYQARNYAQSQRKPHHIPVQSNLADPRQTFRKHALAHLQHSRSHGQSQHSSADAQQKALQHRLTQQRRRRGSQRQPHRYFSLPPDRPHQHQSRQVHARNQEHHRNRKKQRL